MGIVYRGRYLKFDRLVVLARLRLSGMSTDVDEAVHRFIREAREIGRTLASGLAAAAATVASIAVVAVLRGGVASRHKRAKAGTLRRGFVIHESRLGYRAAVGEIWRTDATGQSIEHIVVTGRRHGDSCIGAGQGGSGHLRAG